MQKTEYLERLTLDRLIVTTEKKIQELKDSELKWINPIDRYVEQCVEGKLDVTYYKFKTMQVDYHELNDFYLDRYGKEFKNKIYRSQNRFKWRTEAEFKDDNSWEVDLGLYLIGIAVIRKRNEKILDLRFNTFYNAGLETEWMVKNELEEDIAFLSKITLPNKLARKELIKVGSGDMSKGEMLNEKKAKKAVKDRAIELYGKEFGNLETIDNCWNEIERKFKEDLTTLKYSKEDFMGHYMVIEFTTELQENKNV